MATITVRRIDMSNGQFEPVYGSGLSDFISDLDAVAQIVQTRLLLFVGEWWEALNIGLPLFQSILGVPSTSHGVAIILRERIIGSPYVTDVQNMAIDYAGPGRIYRFSALVITQFGSLQVTNMPLPGTSAVVTN